MSVGVSEMGHGPSTKLDTRTILSYLTKLLSLKHSAKMLTHLVAPFNNTDIIDIKTNGKDII